MTRIVKKLSAKERTAMVAAARDLLGARFRHCGRGGSVDCIGLVVVALKAVGREVQDRRAYGRNPEPEGQQLREVMAAHFGKPIKKLKPGAVVTMQWHGQPNHVGIIAEAPYTDDGKPVLTVIHADANAGRVVEHRLSQPWDRRVIEGWLP
jgi:cell wall-associated NlpC family hydrolase